MKGKVAGPELGDEYLRFPGQVSLARAWWSLAGPCLLAERPTEYQIFADTLMFLPHTWQSIPADSVVHISRRLGTLGQLGRVAPGECRPMANQIFLAHYFF